MNTFGLLLMVLALGLLWSRTMAYTVWFLAGEGVLLSFMVWTSEETGPDRDGGVPSLTPVSSQKGGEHQGS